jgi:hypothetical protein
LQEIFENSLLNLSIENSKQISNNHPHNRANNLHPHHCRDMEALVTDMMEGIIRGIDIGPNEVVIYRTNKLLNTEQNERLAAYMKKAFPNNPCIVVDAGASLELLSQNERWEHVSNRLDAITEMLAVLLDSVQDEAEEQEQADLDGEVIKRVKHEQEWL